jgi:hypothetical protein
MQQFARAALVAVLLGLSGSLQGCGCGCDEDAGQECVRDNPATGCDAFAPLTKCIDNAGCCDFDDDGKKMKDAIALTKETLTFLYGCTGSQMTDNCA